MRTSTVAPLSRRSRGSVRAPEPPSPPSRDSVRPPTPLSRRSQRSLGPRALIVRLPAAARRANQLAAAAERAVADAAADAQRQALRLTEPVAAAAAAAAVAAAENEAVDRAAPRARISVSTSSDMRVEWNTGGLEEFHSHELHGDLEFVEGSTVAFSPPEPVPSKARAARMSTGGDVPPPVTQEEHRPRLRKLRRKLRRRVRRIIGNAEHDEALRVAPPRPSRVIEWYRPEADCWSESGPTGSMYPPGDPEYAAALRDGSRKIHRSLTRGCARSAVRRRYKNILRLLPPTQVKAGLVGMGLFVFKRVKRFGFIAEYTVNRVSGEKLKRLNCALDYHGLDPHVFVDVPSEDAVIDPRVCGNQGQFANHSCSPNARLVEVDVRGKTLIFLCALRALKPGEEVLIDYKWYSDRPGSPRVIPCLCRSPNCRRAI